MLARNRTEGSGLSKNTVLMAWAMAALAITGGALWMAVGAHAQSGAYFVTAEITRAHATARWTHGNVVGSITFTCVTPDFPCGTWQPYLEVSPISSGSASSDRCESNFVTIWEGQPQTTNGTQSFSLPKVPLFTRKRQGIFGQAACPGFKLRIPDCDSPLVHECNDGGFLTSAMEDFTGRNPCKGNRRNRLAHAARQLTVRQYEKKFCPNKGK